MSIRSDLQRHAPLIILLTILFGVLLYLFIGSIERYKEEVDLGWSQEARRNPYLAAEQYLESLGMPVESSYQLDIIGELPSDATLFISDANAVLNERRAQQLIQWMERGGHIIIAAQLLQDGQHDVFLDRFGVEKYSDEEEFNFFDLDNDKDQPEEDDKSLGDRFLEENKRQLARQSKLREREEMEKAGKLETVADELAYDEQRLDSEKIMRLSFDNNDYTFRILLNRAQYLTHPAIWDDEYQGYQPFYWEGTDAGTGFMQFEVEDGLLTVLSDQTIWTSNSIGLLDHAYLLQLLTETSERVVFLYGAVVPSLFDLIWANFYELCVVLLLLLACWMVYHGRRFGPILDTSNLGRRSFREHLSAVGDFFWRHKQREELLAGAREGVWAELRRKHFATRNFDENERLQKIAELSGETPERVSLLMVGDVPNDEFMFYQRVKSLQKLRKQL